MTENTDTHEALRAELRAHLEHRGTSIARAAKAIGMSAPVISSWLKGTYAGDSEGVAALTRRWLRTEREASRLRTAGLHRHAMLGVTATITGLAAHAQANQDAVLVYGAPGAGKTWALERFRGEHSGVRVATMSPALTTPAAVLSRIARSLDAAEGVTTARQLEDLVVDWLKGRGALLVVDEAHHLSAALLDQVRMVYDLSGCGLVLSGNDPLRARLKATGRAGQLLSRIGISRRFRKTTETDALLLAETLLRREPGATGRGAILAVSNECGGLRAVHKAVSLAAVFARADGREDVRDADLVEASDEMRDDA